VPQLQPKESPPLFWLHFVLTMPDVGQPVLSCMHLQRSAGPFDAQAVGVVLQLPGDHVIAEES
jgi:hypothetical protein